MRILIISQWFDPEPADVKGLPFARELVRRGHEVVVITGFPNYPGGKIYPGYRLRAWQIENRDGVKVVRVPLYPSHDRNKIGRILNYATFTLAASTIGLLHAGRCDVAYIYHPPVTVAIPGLIARLIWGTRCVIDIQDLWPDAIRATGMITNPRILRVIGGFSSFINRRMDRVVVLSPGFGRKVAARGVEPGRIHVIYNWSRLDGAPVSGVSLPSEEEAKLRGKFNIVFAGNMGPAQGLQTVLDTAARMEASHPDVQFVMVGGGIDADSLKVRAAGLANIVFLPRRHPSQMNAIFERADVLLVHLRDDPHFAITIPSKTQDYLASGRPVAMAVRGDAAEVIARSGGGEVCEPENPVQLAGLLARLVARSPEERAAMGRAGRVYYEQHLSLRAGTDRFMDLFQALLDEHTGASGMTRAL